MSNSQSKQARKIWQPLNRKSQILATIAVLAIAAFQMYSWYARSTHPQSSQMNPVQQPSTRRRKLSYPYFMRFREPNLA
jgi:hypothetical protein